MRRFLKKTWCRLFHRKHWGTREAQIGVTPIGPDNSYVINYVRVWEIDI